MAELKLQQLIDICRSLPDPELWWRSYGEKPREFIVMDPDKISAFAGPEETITVSRVMFMVSDRGEKLEWVTLTEIKIVRS